MALPQDILDDLEKGRAYLSDRNAEYIGDLISGCTDCSQPAYCLASHLRAFDKITDYDDIAKIIHDKIMYIIGDYVALLRPQVYAGVDKTVNVDDSISFTATITPGSASITNILWTQLFGPSTATLSGANTATLTASDLEVGDYIFKIEVTDGNGFKAFDTVVLVAYADAPGGSANIFTTPKGKYSTISDTVVDGFSIIIEELIGADLSFFTAHRGFDQTFGGATSAPNANFVQVDIETGLVTFAQEFNADFPQDLWFDYKTGSVTPPDPTNNGGFPITFPFTFLS